MKKGLLILVGIALLVQGCALTKEERQNKRANRKLEHLTDKYPQLLEKDTIRDTVIVDSIHIDTVFQTSQDVSGVDSILAKFNDKLDSVTSIKLGDEIKYYVTHRQVIEDTITHIEDGVTVKLWQDGDVIGISVHKPQETIIKEIPVEVVRPAPDPPMWKQVLQQINQFTIPIIILLLLIYGAYRILKLFITKK